MSRSEPEGAPEGGQPPEGRAPQGTHTGHTQTDQYIYIHTHTDVNTYIRDTPEFLHDLFRFLDNRRFALGLGKAKR